MESEDRKYYVFFLWDSERIIWQMALETDDPKTLSINLIEEFNRKNEWRECKMCEWLELDKWVNTLKERGKDYV